MDQVLLTILLTVLFVIIAASIIVVLRQIKINKIVNDAIVSGSDNHVMDSSKYSGFYSVCEHIGD